MKEAMRLMYRQNRLMLSMSHYHVHASLIQQRTLGKVYDIRADLDEAVLQLKNMSDKLEKVREHVGAAKVAEQKLQRQKLPIEETPDPQHVVEEIETFLNATVSKRLHTFLTNSNSFFSPYSYLFKPLQTLSNGLVWGSTMVGNVTQGSEVSTGFWT